MLLFKNLFHDLKNLHSFSKSILAGTLPLVGMLLLFSAVMDRLALYTPDIQRSLRYSQAALSIAPATLAAGVVAALLCDLILRGKASGNDNKDPQDEETRSNKNGKE